MLTKMMPTFLWSAGNVYTSTAEADGNEISFAGRLFRNKPKYWTNKFDLMMALDKISEDHQCL